jgi:hypothetical protein
VTTDKEFIGRFDLGLTGPTSVFDGSLALLIRFWPEILATFAIGAVPFYVFAFNLVIPPFYYMKLGPGAVVFGGLWLFKDLARTAAVHTCQTILEGGQASIRRSFIRALGNFEVMFGQSALSAMIYLSLIGCFFNVELFAIVLPLSPLLLYQYVVNLMTSPVAFVQHESYLSARWRLAKITKGETRRVFWISVLAVFFLLFLCINLLVGLSFIAMIVGIFSAGRFEPVFTFLEGDEPRVVIAILIFLFLCYEVFFIPFSVAVYRYFSNRHTGDDLITRLRILQSEETEE